jgi:hypothetical protein
MHCLINGDCCSKVARNIDLAILQKTRPDHHLKNIAANRENHMQPGVAQHVERPQLDNPQTFIVYVARLLRSSEKYSMATLVVFSVNSRNLVSNALEIVRLSCLIGLRPKVGSCRATLRKVARKYRLNQGAEDYLSTAV